MENAYAEETKFLSDKAAEKLDFASFLPTKQGQKKNEKATPAATKKPQTLI